MSAQTDIVGQYLICGPAVYKILARDDEALTLEIVAGSRTVRGRTTRYPLGQARWDVAHRHCRLSPTPPLDPEDWRNPPPPPVKRRPAKRVRVDR